ncbi:AsnC family transcriptional regulator protein [Sinorhizobium fredii]|uniref:AsnC family transcriptional regulator protein n=1 Tax=Rhizobium fredii TaxID=380 RepID=A0A2L0H7T4_RHIFR|nr:Lrp/AsnC family transcriptional regulator [Sinorhizobium fredii]AUX77497.1 AsnC family transcriptional regulator protein [Sinorhizobium fredii]
MKTSLVVCRKHIAKRMKKALKIRASFCKFVSGVTMPPPNAPQLDAFDRQILEILRRDNTTPQRTIGGAERSDVKVALHLTKWAKRPRCKRGGL